MYRDYQRLPKDIYHLYHPCFSNIICPLGIKTVKEKCVRNKNSYFVASDRGPDRQAYSVRVSLPIRVRRWLSSTAISSRVDLRNMESTLIKFKNEGWFSQAVPGDIGEPQPLLLDGNLRVGAEGDLTLADLRALGFQAILVTVGAQGTKWVGLPGEKPCGGLSRQEPGLSLQQVPAFTQERFRLGKRCAIIGAGNVMLDIAYFMIHRSEGGRSYQRSCAAGPGEVNFHQGGNDTATSRNWIWKLLKPEMKRVLPVLQAINQDPEIGRHKMLDALPKRNPNPGDTRLRFRIPDLTRSNEPAKTAGFGRNSRSRIIFWLSITRSGKRAGTGHKRTLDVEAVIFAIGDKIDDSFGLPTASNAFAMNPSPRFPIDKTSYEAFDPDAEEPIQDVFVADGRAKPARVWWDTHEKMESMRPEPSGNICKPYSQPSQPGGGCRKNEKSQQAHHHKGKYKKTRGG